MSSQEQKHSEIKASPQRRSPKLVINELEEATKQQAQPAAIAQRAKLDPRSLAPHEVLQLQRTIGNQPLQRLLAGAVIQRRGTYNPINITLAGNINAIEEQEYGSGATVAFTSITSCVGFLARAGTQVYGLHLGVLDANGVDVSTINRPNLVTAIGAIWPANLDAVYQVGMTNNWDGNVLTAIYPTVFRNATEVDQDLNQSGKIYSATIVGGKLQVSRNNLLLWTEP